MKILLFGGTFDPPHIGHMKLLEGAVGAVAPDVVVVAPAGTPPHKAASATPAALRLAMCRCFCPLFQPLVVSDIEVHRQGKSYTFETVCSLEAQYPGAEFYLSVGGDMLLSFTTWYHYEELLRQVTLVVQGRHEPDGVLAKAARRLEKEGGRLVFAKTKTPRVSSTEIREGIAAGEDLWALIPPPADEIVRENGLYVRT